MKRLFGDNWSRRFSVRGFGCALFLLSNENLAIVAGFKKGFTDKQNANENKRRMFCAKGSL